MMFTRKPVRAALAALLALTAAPAALGFGIGLQPTTVEMDFEPGDRRRQVVNIANVHTEKTISLTLGLADWSLNDAGQIRLSPPGETENSASEWVRFSPAFVTLKPGESEQITVDMSTPVRLQRSGDFRFALLASTILPEERGGGSGVWKKYQLASLFYLTAPGSESKPEVVNSSISVDETGRPVVGVRIENQGNSHARLEGQIEVQSGEGEASVLPIGNLVVLDGGARNYVVPLESAASDDVEIKVELTNIHAPQAAGGVVELPTWSSAQTIPAAGSPQTEPLN